ncbi:MAG: hypothetical protein RLY93_10480 [Sumerlaeia bacterium]
MSKVEIPEEYVHRTFQLWNYDVSHGHLLIRSPKRNDDAVNVDVVVFGVQFVSLPRFLRGLRIQKLEEVPSAYQEYASNEADKAFRLESRNDNFLIIACSLEIQINEDDIFTA